ARRSSRWQTRSPSRIGWDSPSACGPNERGGCRPSSASPATRASRRGGGASAGSPRAGRGTSCGGRRVRFGTGNAPELLELELTRRGIPFVKYGGLRFLDAAHVKDLLAVLRLVDNPADEVSWFRVLQLLDGVGPTRARRILDTLRAPRAGPADLSRWPQAAVHVPASSREHAAALIGALAGASASAVASASADVE